MQFEEYLAEQFPDDWETDWAESPVLEDGMEYALTSGGKRLRPLLCLKLCDALDGDREQAKVYARAVEAFHNFTLVHDDIMDDDTMRRGQDAVWEEYGLAQGITIGDALHMLGYYYLIDNHDAFDPDTFHALLEVFNKTDKTIADGQSMDLRFREQDDVTEEEYLEMVRKKTGALLAAALQGAAVIADAEDAVREQIDVYGNKIGPAFQIRDDVIDLVGEKGRDAPGQDIGEGKRSLIVVKALNRLDDGGRDELLTILDTEKKKTTQADVDRAVELLKSVDAIDDANQVAKAFVGEAKHALDRIEEHGYNMGDIREITEFLVERKF